MKPRKIKKFVKTATKSKKITKHTVHKPITQQQPKVKQQQVVGIPGILPTAAADPMGALKWIPKKQAISALKGMFGMTGKHTGVTDKRSAAAFLKQKKKIERSGGAYQFVLKPQHGVHKAKTPKRKVWSPTQKRSVVIDPLRVQSAQGESVIVQKADPGAAKEWFSSLFVHAKGPAESGSGIMKDLGTKKIKDMKGGTQTIDNMYVFRFGYTGKNLPKGGVYTDLSGNLISAGRTQQGRQAGSWKPEVGKVYSPKTLPEGAGIQTKYVKWRDQSASAPVIAKDKDGKLVQVRPKSTFEYPTGAQNISPTTMVDTEINPRTFTEVELQPWRESYNQSIYRNRVSAESATVKSKATGKTTAVKGSPTKTTLPGPINKKQKRQVRQDVLAGNISTARQIRVESIADRAFANAVNKGTVKLDDSMDLAIWQRLDYKSKAFWLQSKGLI